MDTASLGCPLTLTYSQKPSVTLPVSVKQALDYIQAHAPSGLSCIRQPGDSDHVEYSLFSEQPYGAMAELWTLTPSAPF
jgi:hypothetical protein